MAKGVNHYLRDGTKHAGSTHKHADGSMMSGAKMSKASITIRIRRATENIPS